MSLRTGKSAPTEARIRGFAISNASARRTFAKKAGLREEMRRIRELLAGDRGREEWRIGS